MSSTLMQGLEKAAKGKKETSTKVTEVKKKGTRPGRILIGGHFDPAVRSTLLTIRAKHPEKTTQALLEEALNLLFDHYKMPQSARLK